MKNQLKNNWKLFLIASLTLGLAPFNPPHIWGKIEWILGGKVFSGNSAMQVQDCVAFPKNRTVLNSNLLILNSNCHNENKQI